MATSYKSQFLKADMRSVQLQPHMRQLATKCDDGLTVADIYAAPGACVALPLAAGCLNIIFPVAGGILVTDAGSQHQLSPEELYCYSGNNEKEIWIENPYPADTINFLHICINQPDGQVAATIAALSITEKNRMVQAMAGCLKVGVYDSRVKDRITLSPGCNRVFTYVINGSFEVEERLMEYRDGLCLWDVSELEFEALSETAIILVIEYSPLK